MCIRTEEIHIRTIKERDNAALAHLIRATLKEFGANRPGTVYYDSSTDTLFEQFQNTPGSIYYVAEYKNEIVGGGGIFPSNGLPQDTCELVKMYLLPEARGIGLGRTLIEKCLETASEFGFHQVYLETLDELHLALKIYAKFGFEYLSAPLGQTKHFGCGLWMLKKL